MTYSRRLHAHVSHMAVAQMSPLSQGFAHTISRMSRSSDRNSIPRFSVDGGVETRGEVAASSRTPRFLMDQTSDDSFGHSSGGSPAALEAS